MRSRPRGTRHSPTWSASCATKHATKLDVVTSAGDLRADGGRLRVGDAGHDITPDGVTRTDAILVPTHAADASIARKLDIPTPYLRRLRDQNTALWDANVNGWLDHDRHRRFLVRGLAGPAWESGVLRALLSDNFRIVDNLDVLIAALNGLRAADVPVDITQADLTETRMYVKVRSEVVAAQAPQLLANYVSPFTGARGADNPLVFAGFVISNSETGHGSFKITPQLTVQICNNGMTLSAHAVKEIHLGGKLPDGAITWSRDTNEAALALVAKQTRDAVRAFLDPAFLTARIAELSRSAQTPITAPTETLTYVGKELRFTQEQQQAVLEHFITGADLTAGGVMHAVTAAAQVMRSADIAHEMEAQGVRAMQLAASGRR